MKKTIVSIGIVLILGGLLVWFYLPPLSRYHDLKIEEQRVKKQIEILDEKMLKMEEERDLLKNDVEYLEKVVREQLGLVKPGEVAYKFVETENPKTEKQIIPETLPVGDRNKTVIDD